MMNELEARVSPNPIFTALLQEQNAEHQSRLMYAQVEVGHPLARSVQADVVHDPVSVGDQFPYRASARVSGGLVGRGRPFLLETGEDVIAPTSFTTFVSATPTGSINLNLRRKDVQ